MSEASFLETVIESKQDSPAHGATADSSDSVTTAEVASAKHGAVAALSGAHKERLERRSSKSRLSKQVCLCKLE